VRKTFVLQMIRAQPYALECLGELDLTIIPQKTSWQKGRNVKGQVWRKKSAAMLVDCSHCGSAGAESMIDS